MVVYKTNHNRYNTLYTIKGTQQANTLEKYEIQVYDSQKGRTGFKTLKNKNHEMISMTISL